MSSAPKADGLTVSLVPEALALRPRRISNDLPKGRHRPYAHGAEDQETHAVHCGVLKKHPETLGLLRVAARIRTLTNRVGAGYACRYITATC